MLIPIAVALATAARGAPAAVRRWTTAVAVALALCVVVYSWLRVRSGRWSHIDASAPEERGELNPFLAILLLGAAAALWVMGRRPQLAAGVAAAGALVIAAHGARRFLKVSLHCAFATFAAVLPWPNGAAVLVLLAVAAAVAWSRLALDRHTPREVVVGSLAGAAAGLAFQLLAF